MSQSIKKEGTFIGGEVTDISGETTEAWQRDSIIDISASGEMSILAPEWTHEILAEGFAEYATGQITNDVVLSLEIDFGTHKSKADISILASSTTDNSSIGDLKQDIETAIANATFTVIESTEGTPAVGSTHQSQELNVKLLDSRIKLVSNYAFTLKSSTSQNAELIGFTKLEKVSLDANRIYSVDAPMRGSIVNIGSKDLPSGDIHLAGHVRGYEAVNIYAPTLDFQATGLVETISGNVNVNATDGELHGNLLANGRDAAINVHADHTLNLHGGMTSQNNINVTAGTTPTEGEENIITHGTSSFTSTGAGGTISLVGVNDVKINSILGVNNPELEVLELKSSQGLLYLDKTSGQIDTSAQLMLSGKKLQLDGVITTQEGESSNGLDENYQLITSGGRIGATGEVNINAGKNSEGLGYSQSALSTVFVESLDDANEATLTINAKGMAQIYGLVDAKSKGADANIISKDLLIVDSLIKADDQLTVVGGSSDTDVGLLIHEIVLDESNNRVSGGVLDTSPDGTIQLQSKDDNIINGMVGQLDIDGDNTTSHVNDISITSQTGATTITYTGSVDAQNSVHLGGKTVTIQGRARAIADQSEMKIEALDGVYVAAGYQQVAVGTIQVPEVTWVTTTVVEEVDQKLIDVGDRYHTMDVTLEKLGYYNPNASEDYDFIGKRLKLSKKIIKS
jgi:hypothetical protein